MIIEIMAQNFNVFKKKVVLNLESDMRNKKFSSNVNSLTNYNILKSVGIYGPNNSGKTCLLKILPAIKSVLKKEPPFVTKNFFDKDEITTLGVTFNCLQNTYKYIFKYNSLKKEFVYEKLEKRSINNKFDVIFIRDSIENNYDCIDKELKKILPILSKDNILIYLLSETTFPLIGEISNVLNSFADKIEFVDMNNIPMKKTLEILKSDDEKKRKIIEFIKNADLSMDNIRYDRNRRNEFIHGNVDKKPNEKILSLPEDFMDHLGLISTYKNIDIPSILFDSTGTKKITALASYIIESLDEGKILIVDEIDSSIHFLLTRAIVAMFNNDLNKKAQLIFSVHDINLMDCRKLFRKEQIWFITKLEDDIELYSLGDFTAKEDKIRDTSALIDIYKKGALGALPSPRLINSLISIINNEESYD